MVPPFLVLAGVALLSAALLVIFAIFVIGIQRCDRGHRGLLFDAPQCHSDAFTRRVLVGVRRSTENREENGK